MPTVGLMPPSPFHIDRYQYADLNNVSSKSTAKKKVKNKKLMFLSLCVHEKDVTLDKGDSLQSIIHIYSSSV